MSLNLKVTIIIYISLNCCTFHFVNFLHQRLSLYCPCGTTEAVLQVIFMGESHLALPTENFCQVMAEYIILASLLINSR